jgi:receptor expression-enhancing protein 5/6
LIGFLYPAYASIKAIETPIKEDDTKWLMYWCVYALFGILEFFSDLLLFCIPFYTLTKCLFLIWLMVPGKNGGTYIVYNRLLGPFVIKNQDRIDRTIGQAKDTIGKVINETASKSD